MMALFRNLMRVHNVDDPAEKRQATVDKFLMNPEIRMSIARLGVQMSNAVGGTDRVALYTACCLIQEATALALRKTQETPAGRFHSDVLLDDIRMVIKSEQPGVEQGLKEAGYGD